MINPRYLKSNILRRIVADAQWEAGEYNRLAISARVSGDTGAHEHHAAEAEAHRIVARSASAELTARNEPLR